MGNVQAASQTGAPPPPPSPPGPTPTATPPVPEPTPPDNHPGSFEDLHKKCKDVFPTPVEGCKLLINKGLSNHFQISHTIALSSVGTSSYHFGTTYVGTKQISPTEAFPVLLGDLDSAGNLNAQIIHNLFNNVRGKCVIQTQGSKFAVVQLDADYHGSDYTASVTVGNPDIINESGILVGHYLQRVTSRLCLGAELLYHYGQGQEGSVVTLAGTYTGANWTAACNVAPAGWHVSYYHKANSKVQVGVELETNLRGQDTAVSLGYQIDVPEANLVFRGMLDTNFTVAGVLEKRLLPMPFTFIISGLVNHWRNTCRFGFGLMVG